MKDSKNQRLNDSKANDRLGSYFKRCGQSTPPFFRKLRVVGLVIAAAGTTLLASPIALPATLVTLGGYLVVGGAVATAMSQAAIVDDTDCEDQTK